MNDVFYIGAYWTNRKQKLEEILQPALNVLQGLSVIDNQFQYYYELGNSRKQALEKQVVIRQNELHRLFLLRVKKNDLDWEGYNSIGYRLGLWNGQSDYESSSVSFNVGCSSPRLGNNILIKFPSEGEAKQRLLGLPKVRQIIDLVVENFNPDILVLNSRRLQEELDVVNEVGWVTYKRQLIKNPTLSHKIIHDSSYKGGHLFYLRTDTGLANDYDLINDLKILKTSF
ncbi:Imm52 family immunity protein [Pedobacter deserti]|uniref:Imm52 family immunity protein n=1 Tax=Pedobacter deserti TaxID=2817382 RepID=UPI00210C9812|nr:Imm52 family immunity protein [Pedobacter sp. SYSU D00382]